MTVHYNKKRKRWCYDFWREGRRHQGYCVDIAGKPVTSKRAATQAEAVEQQRAEMAPKVARASELTLAQVVADLTATWKREADWTSKAGYLRELLRYFGQDSAVASIDDLACERYRNWALEQPVKIWAGGPKRDPAAPENERFWKTLDRTRSASTVNRSLPTLRAIFNRAYKTRDPITQKRAIEVVPKIEDLPKLKRKARPIPDLVLTDVMAILPGHVVEALTATLFFGFRRGEIFGLQIPDIDFERSGVWLRAEEVKDKEDAFLPGGTEAMAFLRKLVDQARARAMTHLITWRPKRKNPEAQEQESWRPIVRPKSAWQTAMDTIEKRFGRRYRWHDIRAAFITHVALTSGGTVAKELARHSDYRTTEAYILVSEEAQRAAAQTIARRPALAVVSGESLTEVPDAEKRRTASES